MPVPSLENWSRSVVWWVGHSVFKSKNLVVVIQSFSASPHIQSMAKYVGFYLKMFFPSDIPFNPYFYPVLN